MAHISAKNSYKSVTSDSFFAFTLPCYAPGISRYPHPKGEPCILYIIHRLPGKKDNYDIIWKPLTRLNGICYIYDSPGTNPNPVEHD